MPGRRRAQAVQGQVREGLRGGVEGAGADEVRAGAEAGAEEEEEG